MSSEMKTVWIQALESKYGKSNVPNEYWNEFAEFRLRWYPDNTVYVERFVRAPDVWASLRLQLPEYMTGDEFVSAVEATLQLLEFDIRRRKEEWSRRRSFHGHHKQLLMAMGFTEDEITERPYSLTAERRRETKEGDYKIEEMISIDIYDTDHKRDWIDYRGDWTRSITNRGKDASFVADFINMIRNEQRSGII